MMFGPRTKQTPGIGDSLHRIDARFEPGDQAPDGARPIHARLIGGDHRRRFGDAIAFEQFQRIFRRWI